LVRHPDSEFILFGDSSVIEPVLRRHPRLAEAARVVHTDVAVKMDEKPSQALRHGRWKSSIWLALDAVRKGEADVAVSAGNTGALMAMAKFNLKTIEGIERPAIAAIWPTLRGESVVLDVGASIGADAEHLCDLAAMGSAMACVLFDIERPTVGLLNIGVEEVKGLDEVRKAGQILREQPVPYLEYYGFVEGDDIGKGTVDVVITEGFAGNIALKTAEGTARQIGGYLRGAMSRTWKARLGYWLAREAFRALREKMDPARSNGGVFLGLNGIVIKSHGGADVEGFAAAVDLGYDMARYELMAKIRQALARGRQTSAVAAVGGAAL
jgi:glycerol-3-phosphate acyltransferase PlsX